jgi:sugar lactone lactonase YvrE
MPKLAMKKTVATPLMAPAFRELRLPAIFRTNVTSGNPVAYFPPEPAVFLRTSSDSKNLPIGFEVEAYMSKVTTAMVSLLVVASVLVFSQWVSARLAANSIVSSLFLVLVLVLTIAGMGSRQGWRRRTPGKRFLRYAAPGLLVLLAPALLWAGAVTSFDYLVSVLSTGGITLNIADDVIVDNQGNLYIADDGNNQIVEVTAAGVASVLAFPGLSPALHNPQAVALDGAGNLFVADGPNSRVVELSGGVASVVNTGSLLSYPDGVVLDPSGNLYIADAGNNSIVEVPAGGAAAVLAITGLGTPLSGPGNIAVDVSGNLYIADAGNNRIVVVAPGGAGTVLNITGGLTLSIPLGVAVDGFGNVYVADRDNNRIVTVTPAGVGNVLGTQSTTLHFPRGVAVDFFGTVYINDNNGSSRIVEVERTTVGFGHLPLQAGSGTTQTLLFTIGGVATFGSVQAFTEGTASLDFTVASTTCIAGVTAGGNCTVNVTFLPTSAGLRKGAVVIYNDASPNVPILILPIYGWGDSPVAAFSPNAGSVISTGGLTLSDPYQVALDGAGNMYVGDYTGSNVTRIPAGGGTATLVALGTPGSIAVQNITGVAMDGAGNLFIGDHENSRILVVTPGGVVSVLSITGLSPALGFPTALALDAAGNLYIADFTNGRIVRVSTLVVVGSTSSGVGAVIATGAFPFTGSTLTGLTVDAQGNIYAAARTENDSSIIKVTAAGVASELTFPGITPAISDPQGVAVDALGNVYVVDTENNRIVRLTTAGVASALGISGMPAPSTLGSTLFGVTLDSSGNLYIPDWSNNRLVFVNVSSAVLAFPSTDVGSTSSPQTATVANLGDLPLIFATVPTYTVNFSEDTGDENLCALSTSLEAGTLCDVAVEFTPQSAGSLSAGIVVTNNSLNLTATTQNVAVSGTGIAVADTTAVAVSTNPTSANIGQPLTVTAIVTDTTAGHSATIPTGGVTFTDTVGATVISLNGGSAVTLNGAGTAILAGVTLSGAGVHTITAHYVGVTGSFAASSNVTTLTVSKDTAALAGPVTQPVQVPSGTAGSVPVTVTGPYSVSVVAAPTGSLSYSVLNSLSVSVASGTATLTAGETDSTTTITLANSLASGNYTVSLTYGGDTNYAAISTAVTIPVVVGPAAPTISWTPAGGITYGTTLSGILNASAVSGSTPVAGTFTYTATLAGGSPVAVTAATVLAAGSYTITATFTPTDTTIYASTSASVALAVAKATPALALTSSAASVGVGSAVTFTATLTSSAGTPSGSVSFYDGTTLLGTGTLALGVVTYTTTNLPVGALSITAVYGGDSNFSTLTSLGLTESVLTAFTVTAPTTPVPVAPGGAAIIDLMVPPLGGAFDSVVTLSASGLPPGATATFNPPTVTPGSAGAPTVMTVQLATLAAGIPARDIPAHHKGPPLAPLSLGFVLFGAVLGRKRMPRGLALVLALASLGVATSLLTGCGGGFANTPSTPAGNYTVTVTGTSGSFQASTTVTLVVQ